MVDIKNKEQEQLRVERDQARGEVTTLRAQLDERAPTSDASAQRVVLLESEKARLEQALAQEKSQREVAQAASTGTTGGDKVGICLFPPIYHLLIL